MSNSERAKEDLSCDFLAFLEGRRSWEATAAAAWLGEALVHHQAGPAARAMALAMRRIHDRV